MTGTMIYGLAIFLPSMVNQLGFNPNVTQLFSAGPFAAAFIGEWFFFKKTRHIKTYLIFQYLGLQHFSRTGTHRGEL